MPARGALLDRDRHPETRQFLILAAIKRADELNRLRELPDTPARSDKAQPKVAGLPSHRSDTDPDETGTNNETPGVSIPVEIGEPSSNELPVAAPEEAAAAANSKPQRESRRRAHRGARRQGDDQARAAQQFNFFEMLFGGQQYQRPAYGPQQAGPHTNSLRTILSSPGSSANSLRMALSSTASLHTTLSSRVSTDSRRMAPSNTSHTRLPIQASSRLFPRCPAPRPISAGLDSSSATAEGLLATPRADHAMTAAISGSRGDRYTDWTTMQRHRRAHTSDQAFSLN